MRETYVVHVTRKCNMKCLYCYEKEKHIDGENYSWKQIKEYILNLVKYRTSDFFHIEFLGGEPMLNWNNIKRAYELFESMNLKIWGYTITTNGTILSPEIIEYLKRNPKIRIAVSLDGKEWSNQLRIMGNNNNSYKTAMKNIKTLLENDISIFVHMVTHPYNIAYLEENIEHFYNEGIKDLGVGTIESTMKIDKEYCDLYVNELNKVSNKIIDGTLAGLNIDVLESLKPEEDVRSYIKNESGEVVGESYGRSGNDISHQDVYDVNRCNEKTEIGRMIHQIRKKVYLNHQRNKITFSGMENKE